jgi:anaerobic ribonucleoside-triphosphate reductase activating protein
VPELTLLLDCSTAEVLLEGPDHVPAALRAELGALLGPGQELGCARPLAVVPPPVSTAAEREAGPCLRVAGLYHNSLIEGPGRRSCLLVSGCTLACAGCWVPVLHAPAAGVPVPVGLLADALLDPTFRRDGISILGGEPFQQPHGLLALVRALRERDCAHVLVYSGYTHERLRRLAARKPAIGEVLDQIDMLVDGPYVEARSAEAGAWTGSGNQRVIDLAALRRKRTGATGGAGSGDLSLPDLPDYPTCARRSAPACATP